MPDVLSLARVSRPVCRECHYKKICFPSYLNLIHPVPKGCHLLHMDEPAQLQKCHDLTGELSSIGDLPDEEWGMTQLFHLFQLPQS